MVQNLVRRSALLAVACTLALPGAAHAGDTIHTWAVNSTADTTDGTCDVSSCTLREAVAASVAHPGSDVYNEIELPAGRYDLSSPLTVTAGSTLNIDVRGAGASQTTISGQNVTRVLVVGTNARLDVEDVALVQGHVAPGGGGIARLTSDARVSFRRAVLADGTASFGGAVSAIDSSRLALLETVVQDNTAGDSDGAGGVAFGGSQLLVEKSTLIGNHSGYAGGLLVEGAGPQYAEIRETTFADNTVTGQAAALRISRDDAGDHVVVEQATIIGNSSTLGGTPGAFHLVPFLGATTSLTGLAMQDNVGGNCFGTSEQTNLAVQSISDDATCGFTAPSSANATDPLLGPVSLQGGEVPVAMPAEGSPALGRVTDCGGSDARGYERLGTGETTCDAGAAERITSDLAVDGTSPVTTVQPNEVATVTVGLRYVSGREPGDAYVRIDPVPGAEIVSVDAYERTDLTHLICAAAAGGYDCIVNGGLADRRDVALRVRRATPGPAQVRVTGASGFLETTPADNDLTVGPTVPAAPAPTGPSGPPGSHPDPLLPLTPSQPKPDLTAPSVTKLTVKRNARTKRYVAGFTLSKNGRVQLILERKVVRKGKTRYVKVTTIVRELTKGKRTITLPAKLKGKALARGSYRVSVRGVTSAGRTGKTVRKAFRLR